MKLLSVLIFFFLIKIDFTFAQSNNWQQITLGDSTTVDFPSKPKEVTYKGETAYGLYKDGVLYSVAIRANATDAGLTIEEKRHAYDEAVRGAAKAMKASQISNKIRFEVNGFEGLETTFIAASDKLKNPVIIRMILVNDTFYGLTFSASASPAHTAARQHFFASFAPRLRPAATTPAETHTAAYKIGEAIGKLLVYGGIIAGIIAGIIFLLLRSTAKKKNTSVS
ncbi:hypothetical protein [Hymenobacter bucti]|uniref:Uncharacterized protein n=1 Tax=Hymenobacter bucti TaxID=1844114 RepID=A0ABW4QT29_9BACT